MTWWFKHGSITGVSSFLDARSDETWVDCSAYLLSH